MLGLLSGVVAANGTWLHYDSKPRLSFSSLGWQNICSVIMDQNVWVLSVCCGFQEMGVSQVSQVWMKNSY